MIGKLLMLAMANKALFRAKVEYREVADWSYPCVAKKPHEMSPKSIVGQ